MAEIKVECPRCSGTGVVRNGEQCGHQRYRCKGCDKRFQLTFTYNARRPGVMEMAEDMAHNGSGVRDTARVLGISPGTVVSLFKKKPRR